MAYGDLNFKIISKISPRPQDLRFARRGRIEPPTFRFSGMADAGSGRVVAV
jgi:hypothetical protein